MPPSITPYAETLDPPAPPAPLLAHALNRQANNPLANQIPISRFIRIPLVAQ